MNDCVAPAPALAPTGVSYQQIIKNNCKDINICGLFQRAHVSSVPQMLTTTLYKRLSRTGSTDPVQQMEMSRLREVKRRVQPQSPRKWHNKGQKPDPQVPHGGLAPTPCCPSLLSWRKPGTLGAQPISGQPLHCTPVSL